MEFIRKPRRLWRLQPTYSDQRNTFLPGPAMFLGSVMPSTIFAKKFCQVVISTLAVAGCLMDRTEAQIETVLPYEFWKNDLSISSEAAWTPGSAHMSIAPRFLHGKIHPPANFERALIDLDRMLPLTYVRYLEAHGSPEACLGDADENTKDLHADLIYFLVEKWFTNGDALPQDIDRRFAGPLAHYSEDEIPRVRQMQAAWLLCTYYNWKRSGVTLNAGNLIPDFQAHLKKLLVH